MIKKPFLMTCCAALFALLLPLIAAAEEKGFGPWKELEYDKGTIVDVNFRRKITDEKGRDIRVQHGLGNSARDVRLKWDTSYRYEESEAGLIIWKEEKQFDESGNLKLFIKEKRLNDAPMEIEWFDSQGRRINWIVYDLHSDKRHSLSVRNRLSESEGAVIVSEAFRAEDGSNISEVWFYYDANGNVINAKHYVKISEDTVSLKPYDGEPTEAIKKMASEWFSH